MTCSNQQELESAPPGVVKHCTALVRHSAQSGFASSIIVTLVIVADCRL